MSYGIDIDMLSLGDADCIIITHYTNLQPTGRILIDGGTGSDYVEVRKFLIKRNMTEFGSVLCTHAHRDHGDGLVRLVGDQSFTFHAAWMHDVRKHVKDDALRRASAGDSSQAKDVKQVVDTTDDLKRAFASRRLNPEEPFAGSIVGALPEMTATVLGPPPGFYTRKLGEFTKTPNSVVAPMPPLIGLDRLARLSDMLATPAYSRPAAAPAPFPLAGLEALAGAALGKSRVTPAPVPWAGLDALAGAGALSKSSVQENPTTQPYNETSVILGVMFRDQRLLFTADAGSEGLDATPPDWKNLCWMQVPHHGSDGNLSQANIERFRPQTAFVSAIGDKTHPSPAIYNGLITMGATVYSTHQNAHLRYQVGDVPPRPDYGPAISLKGNSNR